MSSWFDDYGGGTARPSLDTSNGANNWPGATPGLSAGPGSPTPPTTDAPVTDQHTTAPQISDWRAYVQKRQSELPPSSASLKLIAQELKSAGFNVEVPTHAGGLPSDDKLTVNGQTIDFITGVDGPNPGWWMGDVGSGGGGSLSDLPASTVGPYKAPAPYQAPAPFSYPDFNFGTFKAPDPSQVTSDPAYQFRLKQGENALEASASARGTLRTGGTLKDILQYGQDYASSEYDKIYGRAANEFQTAYSNALGAYGQNRANAYGNAVFNTQTGQWEYQTNAQNGLNEYNLNYNAQQDETKNLISFAGIGATAAGNAPAPVPTTTDSGYGVNPGPGATTQGGTLSSLGTPTTSNTSPFKQVDYSTVPSAGLASLYRPNGRAY